MNAAGRHGDPGGRNRPSGGWGMFFSDAGLGFPAPVVGHRQALFRSQGVNTPLGRAQWAGCSRPRQTSGGSLLKTPTPFFFVRRTCGVGRSVHRERLADPGRRPVFGFFVKL